jgi:hypothetical protein
MRTVNPEKIINVEWLNKEKGLIKIQQENNNKRRGVISYIAYDASKYEKIADICEIVCPFHGTCNPNIISYPCSRAWNSYIYKKFCEKNNISCLYFCRNIKKDLDELMKYFTN